MPPVLDAWRALLRHLPNDGPSTFKDDPGKDVQIVSAGTGRRARVPVLLAFCGMAHRFWVPLNLIHVWLSRLGVHIVYVRDFRRIFYLRGVRSLGTDYATSVAALSRIVGELGASSLHCIGSSSGSFGALHMGLDLGARSVLCLAGPTRLDNALPAIRRTLEREIPADAELDAAMLDLRGRYDAAAVHPRIRHIHGGANDVDRLEGENLVGLEGVEMVSLDGFENHAVLEHLIATGTLNSQLGWLLSAGNSSGPRLAAPLRALRSWLARRLDPRHSTA